MINMKEINARVNQCKLTNKQIKDGVWDDKTHANQFYNLRNLMAAVKDEMEMQVRYIVWNYNNSTKVVSFSKEADVAREMINEAEKYGLENMNIASDKHFEIDGKEYILSIDSKTKTLTVDSRNEDDTQWVEIYSQKFDTALEMINAYFDMVDNELDIIQGITAPTNDSPHHDVSYKWQHPIEQMQEYAAEQDEIKEYVLCDNETITAIHKSDIVDSLMVNNNTNHEIVIDLGDYGQIEIPANDKFEMAENEEIGIAFSTLKDLFANEEFSVYDNQEHNYDNEER